MNENTEKTTQQSKAGEEQLAGIMSQINSAPKDLRNESMDDTTVEDNLKKNIAKAGLEMGKTALQEKIEKAKAWKAEKGENSVGHAKEKTSNKNKDYSL